MLSELMMYLQFPFVRYALIVGVLISLCASLLGVILVLRRYSYLGDGLSHVAFGAIAVAAIVRVNNSMFIVLPVTVIAAILLLKKGSHTLIKGDAAIAMISTGSLAAGYLLMNLFPVSGNISADVCTTLFGSTSILTLGKNEVYLCLFLSVSVLAIYVAFYNRIFAITFDEDFSRSCGLKTERYNLLIAIIIAVVIVLAMNLVGSLLISALMIFPVVSAMSLFNSFKAISIFAAIMSVVSALSGIIISILMSTPVGSSIVAVNVVIYLICILFKKK